MKKVPGSVLQSWLVDHKKAVNQLADDLLELSSYVDLILTMFATLNTAAEMITKRGSKRHLLAMGHASMDS